MKIAICGSMQFSKEMLELKEYLEKKNHIVIAPSEIDKHVAGTIGLNSKEEKIQGNLIQLYYNEIKQMDAIIVLNKTKNNIENYIGGNSFLEMAFAHVLNKKNFLTNPIPDVSYKDEIEAMMPIVINDDLSLIK